MNDFLSHTDTAQLYGSRAALPLLLAQTDEFRCVIALQGAQILEFSTGGRDLLWLSPLARFEEEKPVRAGIPLCAPWFGIHPDDPGKAKHGFVRNRPWILESAGIEKGRAVIKLFFTHTASNVFPHEFRMDYTIALSDRLCLEMVITNTGTQAMPFSWAFHSYYPVADLGKARVTGLEGVRYLDATDGFAAKVQDGAIIFPGEIDRVYENVPDRQVLETDVSIEVSAVNCPSCIVWNPGLELAKTLGDVGPEAYQGFVCVERGAVRNNALLMPEGAREVSSLEIFAKK